jgi:WD40 repeat protein
LLHASPVRSVACAPKDSAKSWCIVGCADGSIYLWDLDDTKEPVKVLRDHHRDAVTALAFSPEGKWFASGGNDGQINLWVTAEGSLVYPFDAEHGAANGHQGPITSLHFTPQTRLVSASRDQSLRVWDLHQKGVKLHGEPITGRGASVNHLGVSQDGQWMLFDQGKTLQVLSVDTGRTLSELKNPINAPAFETLALFSPDGSLMLTAGANEGRLQLWRTPTPGARGFEVRQLFATERSPVTCAAFSPNAGLKNDGFAVTGTKEGYVYVWGNPAKKGDSVTLIPTQEELQKHRLGVNANEAALRLTLVDQSTDAGKIRIGVDLDNPQSEGRHYRFIPGQRATVVVVEE